MSIQQSSSSRLNLDPMSYPVISFVSQIYSARYEFPPVKQRKMVGNSSHTHYWTKQRTSVFRVYSHKQQITPPPQNAHIAERLRNMIRPLHSGIHGSCSCGCLLKSNQSIFQDGLGGPHKTPLLPKELLVIVDSCQGKKSQFSLGVGLVPGRLIIKWMAPCICL